MACRRKRPRAARSARSCRSTIWRARSCAGRNGSGCEAQVACLGDQFQLQMPHWTIADRARATSKGGTRLGRRKKILVVDDVSTSLLMSRLLLQGCGYDVVTARDGEEALNTAVAERPDLIMLDVH